jgi:hypothetical protein
MFVILCGCNSEKKTINKEGEIRDGSLMHIFDKEDEFKNFKDTGKTEKEYNKIFLKTAVEKGLDSTKLEKAIKKANELKKNVYMYPVIAEKVNCKGKESYAIVFTWEFKFAETQKEDSKKTVGPLGHIFVVIIEPNSQEILANESCK